MTAKTASYQISWSLDGSKLYLYDEVGKINFVEVKFENRDLTEEQKLGVLAALVKFAVKKLTTIEYNAPTGASRAHHDALFESFRNCSHCNDLEKHKKVCLSQQ